MDYSKSYEKFASYWLERRDSLTKDEVAFIAHKDTWKNKLIGIFSSAYFKREKVIRNGEILFAYAFKCWNASLDGHSNDRVWVLFSPSLELNKNPIGFAKCVKNLESIDKRKYPKLCAYLANNTADCHSILIPSEYSDGKLIYLSILDRYATHGYAFKLGVNPIIASLSLSKEVMFLPQSFFEEEFKKSYLGGEDNG